MLAEIRRLSAIKRSFAIKMETAVSPFLFFLSLSYFPLLVALLNTMFDKTHIHVVSISHCVRSLDDDMSIHIHTRHFYKIIRICLKKTHTDFFPFSNSSSLEWNDVFVLGCCCHPNFPSCNDKAKDMRVIFLFKFIVEFSSLSLSFRRTVVYVFFFVHPPTVDDNVSHYSTPLAKLLKSHCWSCVT